ncbi:hypothetical protein LI177_05370 [bacterium 210820-DFI.6.37]|nr:hypothetical protein [bacterium 210820-DFI.6.37]
MKNREKYKDILVDYALMGISPAVTKEGKIEPCDDITCAEPETDWSKVEVDTKIYVGYTLEEVKEKKKPRYFAGYKDGEIYAYVNGGTSWSAKGEKLFWNCAELAEDI